jgi:hypothetical protein
VLVPADKAALRDKKVGVFLVVHEGDAEALVDIDIPEGWGPGDTILVPVRYRPVSWRVEKNRRGSQAQVEGGIAGICVIFCCVGALQ